LAELKFHIIKNSKSIPEIIPLTNKELNELKTSRKQLIDILKLEELYDQIIESFLEFKSKLYSNSLSLVNSSRKNYIANHEIRSKLNRQLFNTLNLSKLYLDKHFHEKDNNYFVKDITNDGALHNEVREQRTKIYNENSDYRLGYKLRNLTQHSALLIQTYTVGKGCFHNSKSKSIQARFHLPLAKENLIESGINKNLLTYFGDNVDLHEVMDGYIYAISQMHMKNRKLTKPTIDSAENIFLSKVRKIKRLDGENEIEVIENNEIIFYLDLEWYQVVHYLQQKHDGEINYGHIKHNTYAK